MKTIDAKLSKRVASTLAENLRRLMDENKVGAYMLAETSGISSKQIYRYLDPSEGSDPSASNLMRICDALNCHLVDLLGV